MLSRCWLREVDICAFFSYSPTLRDVILVVRQVSRSEGPVQARTDAEAVKRPPLVSIWFSRAFSRAAAVSKFVVRSGRDARDLHALFKTAVVACVTINTSL